MAGASTFSPKVMELDCEAEARRIEGVMREAIGPKLHRKGAVIAVSGGIDSAACLALAVRALGKERVFAMLLPERDSSPESTALGKLICEKFGVQYVIEDIAPALEALGCYRRRDESIRKLFPKFGPGWKMKIAIASNVLDSDRVNFFTLKVQTPEGERLEQRMSLESYLGVVAATNMKQRIRKLFDYYHAERLNYAVIGTPNKLEYDLGFFVRGGDGLADVKPIAHLYKTQVYAMAKATGVPAEICARPPTTDTYTLPQSQEEFYYALPYDRMDLMLYAYHHQIAPETAGQAIGLTGQQVERVYRDIVAKSRMSNLLHQHAIVFPEMP